jgi:hypothetical protein
MLESFHLHPGITSFPSDVGGSANATIWLSNITRKKGGQVGRMPVALQNHREPGLHERPEFNLDSLFRARLTCRSNI